jgi:transcriptional regulator with XRE-family HTH domain
MARTPTPLKFSGAKLRELRDRRGLHQAEVEQLTAQAGHRVSREWISRIENEQVGASTKAIKALVQVYGAAIDDVLAEAS